MAAELSVAGAVLLAEMPAKALQVAAEFATRMKSQESDLSNVYVVPGDGETVRLIGARSTMVCQVMCHGRAVRPIQLPRVAATDLLRRHPEAEMVAVYQQEIGLSLRSFSTTATVVCNTAEGAGDELTAMPSVLRDAAGLELMYDHQLLVHVARALRRNSGGLLLRPCQMGMAFEAEGEDWSATVLVAGIRRKDQVGAGRHHRASRESDRVEAEVRALICA